MAQSIVFGEHVFQYSAEKHRCGQAAAAGTIAIIVTVLYFSALTGTIRGMARLIGCKEEHLCRMGDLGGSAADAAAASMRNEGQLLLCADRRRHVTCDRRVDTSNQLLLTDLTSR
jgi:hypothetical protein